MLKQRYRIYREHKYVLSFLAELEKFIAKMDFRFDLQLAELALKLEDLRALFKGHAVHEDKTIHQLLVNKGSTVQTRIEQDHQLHDEFFENLQKKLNDIKHKSNSEERIALGYDFYLYFREFEADNLKHINEEERIIMPELQRLYSDEELRKNIDFKTYEVMTSDQMFHRLQVLFPVYSLDDKITFLQDILDAQAEKFKVIWLRVSAELLTPEESKEIINTLHL